MLRVKTMVLLLSASLAGACSAPGDFCDVVSGPIEFPAATAQTLVREARPEVVRIDSQNTYWRSHCG